MSVKISSLKLRNKTINPYNKRCLKAKMLLKEEIKKKKMLRKKNKNKILDTER